MNANLQKDAVYIVGLYKNGTSWLLAALAAHPQFTALREIDLLRAAARGKSKMKLRSAQERLSNVFGRNAFCGLRAEQLAPGAFRAYARDSRLVQGASSVFELPSLTAIETISAMLSDANGHPKDSQSIEIEHLTPGKPLSFADIPVALRIDLFNSVRDSNSTEEILNRFIEAIIRYAPSSNRIVLKGADQIVRMPALMKMHPHSPKIAIVRDGRDAAVSAFFYRDLMRQRRLAWHHNYASYWAPVASVREASIYVLTRIRNVLGYGNDWRLGRSMRIWRERVRKVLYWVERDELYLIRYEDLIADFRGSLSKLLTWLSVDASIETVTAIESACSFESMTGRPRGMAKSDTIRRGITREWMSSLTSSDRNLAWRIASKELSLLGYGRDGELFPLHIELKTD
jgi:hypothetical protein